MTAAYSDADQMICHIFHAGMHICPLRVLKLKRIV